MTEHKSAPHSDGDDPDVVEDLDAVADRLEAALTRIAQQLETPGLTQPGPEQRMPQLAARLDGLIERLRDVLGQPRERDSAD
jgi:hypothetical protein